MSVREHRLAIDLQLIVARKMRPEAVEKLKWKDYQAAVAQALVEVQQDFDRMTGKEFYSKYADYI